MNQKRTIIKELAKKFEGEFNCLAEKTKKYKTFSVKIENMNW